MLVVFVSWFVAQERWIYFWDWAGYWERTIALTEQLRRDWLAVPAAVADSVRSDAYNVTPIVPLALAGLVTGNGRVAYVVAIATLYALPAVLALALVARQRLLAPRGATSGDTALCSAAIALLPQTWIAVLVGKPDVVGCVLIALLWAAGLERIADRRPARLLGVGVALALLVVLRRWYAYFAVAFLAALALEAALQAGGARAVLGRLVRLALLGALALAVYLALTGSFGLQVLGTDYAALYQAYASDTPLRSMLAHLMRDFGPLRLGLTALGAGIALGDPRTRSFARSILLQALIVAVAFVQTQSFAAHHYYLILPQIALLSGLGATAVARLRPRPVLGPLVVALLVLDFAAVYVPGVPERLGPLAALLPGRSVRPLVRNDLPEVARLARRLDRLADRSGAIYVLSSSLTLNDEVLRNAPLSDASLPVLGARLLATGHVDRRDGFPWQMLEADYLIVTEPVGYHLEPDEQQIVGVPARDVVAGRTIGAAFARRPEELVLDGPTRVLLFERIRPVTAAEADALRAKIARSYPGHPGFAPR